ncbi:hypothetical protein Clacol_005398 [Clathrus columnatus]|uniref:histidine kinase n=1 Tax=Clathrus columnatus TaxID=1419009 RepID=A0AAV5AF87_9AGAM|nr:hypothetical protein Clacol_005398 [Clathrus columnatus]
MPVLWFDKHRREPKEVLPISSIGTSDAHPPILTERKKSVSFNKTTWRILWAAFKERVGSGSALSESLLLENGDLDKIDPALTPLPILTSNKENNTILDEEEGPIDEVVVDNLLSTDEVTHRTPTEPLGTGTGGSPEKIPAHESRPGTAVTDNDGSLSVTELAWMHSLWTVLRWRLYPAIHRFFLLRFHDEAMEAQFSREAWFTNKQLALWASGRDFLGLLYYASALPAIALFALGQQRLYALFPAIAVLILMSVGIVPFRHTWARSVLNVFVFQMFLLWLHYLRENADRRLYSLREQLKVQFRATQKAQINERQAADSKRRLTSYIFHEVRVPLNTALLAVQNMEASDSIPKGQDIEFAALEGSLSMMSKVLNDVLDFNRMDSGRFESVNRPYFFHTALRSMLVPLQLAVDARGLELHTDMDSRIDDAARRAWYRAQDESPAWIEDRIREYPNEQGIVVGDEMRLRQIITNLTRLVCILTLIRGLCDNPSINSNACKFTPTGGKISVRTKLVYPILKSADDQGSSVKSMGPSLSAYRLSQHDALHSPHMDNIVVRIEIEDTGAGIRQRDLVDNKLFSPYVQTEIGRIQGGKGTGLGLALVRHIVKLSGGRLGQMGVGSTFWVELQLGVGKKALGKPGSSAPSDIVPAPRFSLEGRSSVMFDTSTMNHSIKPLNYVLTSKSSPSALKSIMDQGGLVELAPTRSLILTEQPLLLANSVAEASSSQATTTVVNPTPLLTVQSNKDRPTFITLPEHDMTLFASSLANNPLTPPPVTRPFAVSSSPDPSLHLESPLHALVVDDDHITRQLMARLLTRLGVTVTCAENGAVALDFILGTNLSRSPQVMPTEHRYDVIFLDNQMPVMSGLEVVKKLRNLGRSDFVVGVTGNALLSDQDEYLEAGVNKVLTKPVHERNLKVALNAADVLRKQRSTPQSEQHLDPLLEPLNSLKITER